MHLRAAQENLHSYVVANPKGLIKKEDIDKLDANMTEVLNKVKITSGAEYDSFITTAGLK